MRRSSASPSPPRTGGKKGLCATRQAEVAQAIATLVGDGAADGWDFEALETAARRQALRVAACAVQARLNADTSDHTGPGIACACGQPARYVDRRAKRFQRVLGELVLERASSHCDDERTVVEPPTAGEPVAPTLRPGATLGPRTP